MTPSIFPPWFHRVNNSSVDKQFIAVKVHVMTIIIISISKSYIVYVSTKQGTQGTEFIQTSRKIGYCSDGF